MRLSLSLILLTMATAVMAGCSSPEQPADTVAPAAVSDEAAAAPAAARGSDIAAARSGRPIALPAPIETRPANGPVSPKSLALRADTVERAIAANMGGAAEGIAVHVDKGIVHLSGDVATEADFQKANYVARALDGVIEVDQSQMRIVR